MTAGTVQPARRASQWRRNWAKLCQYRSIYLLLLPVAAYFLVFSYYPMLLGVFAVISVFVPFADSACRKDPWNWEYDVAESGVAAKKAALEAEAAEPQG